MSDKELLIAEILRHEQALSQRVARRGAGPLFDAPLTMQQLRVLFLVHLESRPTGHGIAATLGVSQATVSGIVDRLVAHGLLRRVEDPADRRVRLLRLTPRAEELLAAIEGAGEAFRRELLSLLDADHLAALERVLAELVRRWQLSGAGAEASDDCGRAPGD